MSKNNTRTAVLAVSALMALVANGPAFASKSDKEQAKANFLGADVNNDGKLDFNEFKTFIDFNAQYGIGRASMVRRFGAYGKAFGEVDVNGDGFVTGKEIRAATDNQ